MMVQSDRSITDPSTTANPTRTYHQTVSEQARLALDKSSYSELKRVTSEFHEGILTLRGQVPRYYLKQLAQCLVVRVPGVEQVVNRIDVV